MKSLYTLLIVLLLPLCTRAQTQKTFFEINLESKDLYHNFSMPESQIFRITLKGFDTTKKHTLLVKIAGEYVAQDKATLDRDFMFKDDFKKFQFKVDSAGTKLTEVSISAQAKQEKVAGFHFNFQGSNYLFFSEIISVGKDLNKYKYTIKKDTIDGASTSFTMLNSYNQNHFRNEFVKAMARLYKDTDKKLLKYVYLPRTEKKAFIKKEWLESIRLRKKYNKDAHKAKKDKDLTGYYKYKAKRARLWKNRHIYKKMENYLIAVGDRALRSLDKQGIYFPITMMFGKNNRTNLNFLGTGDLQKTVNSGENFQGNVGLGVSFHTIFERPALFSAMEVDASVNVVSTVPIINALLDTNGIVTNQNTFGSFILLPTNSGRSASANFKGYLDGGSLFRKKLHQNRKWADMVQLGITGLSLSIAAATRQWKLLDTTLVNKVDSTTINAGALSLRLGGFHEFVPFKNRKDYSITVGFDYSLRALVGNIAQGKSRTILNRFTSSSDVVYQGVEFSLNLRVQNIKARVGLPMLLWPKDAQVPGLTGFQFYTTISFVGGFPLKIWGNN